MSRQVAHQRDGLHVSASRALIV